MTTLCSRVRRSPSVTSFKMPARLLAGPTAIRITGIRGRPGRGVARESPAALQGDSTSVLRRGRRLAGRGRRRQFARRFESRQRQEAVGVGGGEVAGEHGLQRYRGRRPTALRPAAPGRRPAACARRPRRRRPLAALAPHAVFREGGGQGRLTQLAHHLGDQLGDLIAVGPPSSASSVRKWTTPSVSSRARKASGRPSDSDAANKGPADLVGVERFQSAVALPHPGGRRQGVVHDCGPPCIFFFSPLGSRLNCRSYGGASRATS